MIVAAASLAGWAAAMGGTRRAILLPFGAALGLALLWLALARFELFVASVLLVRASLDAIKLSSSSLDVTGAVSVVFLVGCAAWLLRRRGGAAGDAAVEPAPISRLLPPLGALFLVALLSAAVSTHPLESATEAVRLGMLAVIVTALGNVLAERRNIRLILVATLASAVIPILVAGLQVLSGKGAIVASGVSRIEGTFQHPNPFATYLGLILTLAAGIWPHVRGRLKAPLGLLALGCGGALLMTYARGAWAGTILALLVVGFLQDRRILWALGASVVVVALAVPSVGTRLSDLSEDVRPSGAPGNSLVWRLQYWREVLAIQREPILGIGLRGVQLDERVSQLPHNDLIRVYVELGVVGLAAYLWLFAALAREALAALRRAPPGLARGLAVAFAGSLASIVLQSAAANIVTQLVILWYFLAIAGLAIAASADTRAEASADR